MRVLEPGHRYALRTMDGEGTEIEQVLCFVNREEGTEHSGTQTQEVVRAVIDVLDCLVDRTNHCNSCLTWVGNARIVQALTEAQRHLRLSLLYHEERALERKVDRGTLQPEHATVGGDGHWIVRKASL
jgi:methyltransferase-like protein